jgi:hypothetical protein
VLVGLLIGALAVVALVLLSRRRRAAGDPAPIERPEDGAD